MKFSVSLKQNHLFRRLYSKGKHAVDSKLALYCKPNGRSYNRLGLTVGTKVGKAVCRNRVRRRLREIYRLHEEELKPGYDLVIVARVRAAHTSYWELDRSFCHLTGKLGLRREEKK